MNFDKGKEGGSILGICTFTFGGEKTEGFVLYLIVEGGTGSGSSMTESCPDMWTSESSSSLGLVGGVEGLKCPGMTGVCAWVRSYAASSAVEHLQLIWLVCHPRCCAGWGTTAVWTTGRLRAAKLAAICTEVKRGSRAGVWTGGGVGLGTTTSLVVVVVVVCWMVMPSSHRQAETRSLICS